MNRVELVRTAQRHGTPLYRYDLAGVRARAGELRAALPAGAELLYSLKANPLAPVVAAARGAGCGAEVSSPGELASAVAAGFDPAEVLYTGPGKAEAELVEVVGAGARLFSCESAAELDRLGRVAGSTGRGLRALLRLMPAGRPAAGLSMSDGRQFGFAADEAAAAWAAAPAGVELLGFHVYLGSQLGSVADLLEGFTHARDVVDLVAGVTGVPPKVVDLGGGFPWPYATAGAGCGLDGLREGLERLLSGWEHRPRLWFETGRRVVAGAGVLLVTVVDVKHRPNGVLVVVDGGINVLGGMSGLGRVLRPRTAVENLGAGTGEVPEGGGLPEGGEVPEVDVVGPLCTPLDRVAARVPVADPKPGDVLLVENVGAYGATASLVSFLSRPGPVELVVDGDEEIGTWRIDGRAVRLTGPA
ncbi:type III PLP-dependent enzyme domain-containing protein [Actinokineospora bangkokensis]|uniref:Orn/DAP/Arg decarboxylase 2 N-terminal domain-containing protein n=1 Tax=Actinokineospora bangkokensis TaxID=1193682 RepID=A0A1Q9LRK8_9PSEU|nr:hypothetical protein [Actinokineospora bangkokensis]OLR94643.1 hypothetical protein BJP25_13030 [Actinokineospora bangkokensis]